MCNRCGSVCLADHSGLEVTYGDLLRDFDEAQIDLCAECSDRFRDWLRSGNGNALGGARAATAPLAGGLCKLPVAKRQQGL
jgi:hypothetical protein